MLQNKRLRPAHHPPAGRVPAGFTLIEMLIVVGILAILVAAVIIAINPAEQFQQARNATRWSHMNAIVNGIYGYVIGEAGWPSGCPIGCTTTSAYAACGVSTDCATTTIGSASCIAALIPGYLPSTPKDPQTGTDDYQIRFYNSAENRIQICPPAGATDSNLPEVIQ